MKTIIITVPKQTFHLERVDEKTVDRILRLISVDKFISFSMNHCDYMVNTSHIISVRVEDFVPACDKASGSL